MRLAVYTDFPYHRSEDGRLWAEQAFGLFVGALAGRVERLLLVGRLDPSRASARHPLPSGVELRPLPHYESLSDLGAVGRVLGASVKGYWQALGEVDAVWLLGPHPISIVFAALALLRGRRVFLGVRQDLPAYMDQRHRDRPLLRFAAHLMEGIWRALSRRCPTVVVGPALAENYGRSREVLPVAISLIEAGEVASEAEVEARDYGGETTLLYVGRLDPEKNPVLAADLLAQLNQGEGPGWRLEVAGDGPLRGELEVRLAELGVAARAELHGYVPLDDGLRELYRRCHFLVLTSWTEGLPQVVIEAFAAGTPVVCTDVGGLPVAAPAAVTTFPPGDAAAGAARLAALRADPAERRQRALAGLAWAREHTAAAEAGRVAEFFARWSKR